MNKDKLQAIVEVLDERKIITDMEQSTVADQAYYNGMVTMANYFGYGVRVDDNGHHTLVKL